MSMRLKIYERSVLFQSASVIRTAELCTLCTVLYIFRFLYFEEEKKINAKTVIPTLHAAKKYFVKELVQICETFLKSNKNEENVCVVMNNASMYSMPDLISDCMQFVFSNESVARKVFKSGGFHDLDKEVLLKLVESDELPLDEYFIYQTLKDWAKSKCKKNGEENPNGEKIREMLGNIIDEIRFPTMSLEKFWKEIASDELLTDKEQIQISRAIATKSFENVRFKSTERKKRASKTMKVTNINFK